ncbi:hypothetical protein MXD81_49295 [Microbacteriaceae bacterium K1510]|nr:hypothetical protein [Microbacteriaceae bacterium K1510]
MTTHHTRKSARSLFVLAAALLVPGDALLAAELTLDALNATRTRPLFSATRRPPPPPKERTRPAAEVTPPQPPDVALSAIVIGTDMRIAFLKRGKDKKTFPVRPHDDVEGWTVTAIEPRQVTLGRDSQQVTLEFPKRGLAATPVATAAAKTASAPQ